MEHKIKLVAKTLIICDKVFFVFAAGSIIFHMIPFWDTSGLFQDGKISSVLSDR